jgi:hypothetical protein
MILSWAPLESRENLDHVCSPDLIVPCLLLLLLEDVNVEKQKQLHANVSLPCISWSCVFPFLQILTQWFRLAGFNDTVLSSMRLASSCHVYGSRCPMDSV